MEEVTSIHRSNSQRDSRADQIRRLKEQIAKAERLGRPADLARQLLEILEQPSCLPANNLRQFPHE
jgi:hypothetical protein